MPRTVVILDGLYDAGLGRELSRRWMAAGLVNVVDPSGQGAELERADGQPLDAGTRTRAIRIAETLGVDVAFAQAKNTATEATSAAWRAQVAASYRRQIRWTWLLGVPILLLHYLRRIEGVQVDHSMVAFNLMLGLETLLTFILVGVVGRTILRRGLSAAWSGYWTVDGYLTVWLLGTWVLSLGVALHTSGWVPTELGSEVWLHAVPVVLLATLWQRRQAHEHAGGMAGRAGLMVPGTPWLLAGWLALSIGAGVALGWGLGVALGLLFPGAGGLVGVNPRQPRWLALLPTGAVAGMLLLGPYALQRSLAGVEVEVAGLLALVLSWVYVNGWRAWRET